MNWISEQNFAQEGDLVEVISHRLKKFIFQLEKDKELHTHRGIIKHEDLIGVEWGRKIKSHSGNPFYLLQPGISDLIETTKRNTQIMYPKDIGFILMQMNIIPGVRVIEAGTGSGGLTQVLAAIVGDKGHVYSYECRDEMLNLAKKNLERINCLDRVSFLNKNARDGFEQENIDAVFLDLPNPFDLLHVVKKSLRVGGYFGTLLPTTNQITKTLIALRRHGFEYVETCEIFLRYYQSIATKFRPVDRMVAHTGYLVFGRLINNQQEINEEQDEAETISTT
jgi:tRNA (adenine57-N1/adenine58-N1)-methyltransferase